MSDAQGAGRMFPGTLGGQSQVASPFSGSQRRGRVRGCDCRVDILADDFTYPNGNLNGTGTWTVPIGSINVSSNQAVAVANTLSLALSSTVTSSHSMDATVDITNWGSPGFSAPDVCVSAYYVNSTTYGYVFGSYDSGTGQWNLACNVNGSFTLFASVAESAPTRPYTMRVNNCRGVLTLYVNGLLKLTSIDSVGVRGLHAGFATGNTNDAVDNCEILGCRMLMG